MKGSLHVMMLLSLLQRLLVLVLHLLLADLRWQVLNVRCRHGLRSMRPLRRRQRGPLELQRLLLRPSVEAVQLLTACANLLLVLLRLAALRELLVLHLLVRRLMRLLMRAGLLEGLRKLWGLAVLRLHGVETSRSQLLPEQRLLNLRVDGVGIPQRALQLLLQVPDEAQPSARNRRCCALQCSARRLCLLRAAIRVHLPHALQQALLLAP